MTTQKTYAQILKASSIMGGAAGVTLLLSMVRVKFAAILVGATGVGLNASLTALQTLVGTIAGLGLQSSAVREIAAAVASCDQQALGRTVLTIRRTCWFTGLVGMISTMLCSPLLSQITFGHQGYTYDIAALGVVVLMLSVSGGQLAVIQGTRRISDIARINILAAAIGTVAAVIYYAALGLRGIVPAMVTVAAAQLALSWIFARKLELPKVELSMRETLREAQAMVRMGLVLMCAALISSGIGYYTIGLISKTQGVAAVGVYSAAFALSGLFVNFVLNAMASDYYPRLSAALDDKARLNQMVNEQTEIALFLAVPGMIATLVFAPWAVRALYSEEFVDALHLLPWFIIGCLGRIISWPVGYVLLVLGKAKTYGLMELFWGASHVILIYCLYWLFGLVGVSLAFATLYLIVAPSVFYVARALTGLAYVRETYSVLIVSILMFVVYLLILYKSPEYLHLPSGLCALSISTWFSIKGLLSRLPVDHRIRRFLGVKV